MCDGVGSPWTALATSSAPPETGTIEPSLCTCPEWHGDVPPDAEVDINLPPAGGQRQQTVLHGTISTQCAAAVSLVGVAVPMSTQSIEEIDRPGPARGGFITPVYRGHSSDPLSDPASNLPGDIFSVQRCVAAGFDVRVTDAGIVTVTPVGLSSAEVHRCTGTGQLRWHNTSAEGTFPRLNATFTLDPYADGDGTMIPVRGDGTIIWKGFSLFMSGQAEISRDQHRSYNFYVQSGDVLGQTPALVTPARDPQDYTQSDWDQRVHGPSHGAYVRSDMSCHGFPVFVRVVRNNGWGWWRTTPCPRTWRNSTEPLPAPGAPDHRKL